MTLEEKLKDGSIDTPWDTSRISLYSFMRGSSFTGNETLPDEAHYKPAMWINKHYLPDTAKTEGQTVAERIFFCLKKFLARQDSESVRHLYDEICRHHPYSYVDELYPLFPKDKSMVTEVIFDLTQWLMTNAPDRHAVLAGMSMSGMLTFYMYEDQTLPGEIHKAADVVMTLGRHEFFSFFAGQALIISHKNGEFLTLQMVQRSQGLARRNGAKTLRNSKDPVIQKWLAEYDEMRDD